MSLHGRHLGTSADPLEAQRGGARAQQALAELKLEKHPDKTFIGRIEKGFDFLGFTSVLINCR
jgi:hypothetical protein